MVGECIFCSIIAGRVPATFVHRDDRIVVIADANPQAPQHLLVIPVVHCADLSEFVGSQPAAAVASLFGIAARMGRERGGDGFRIAVNTGPDGGQTVNHLHVHVLAGRPMQWPPG